MNETYRNSLRFIEAVIIPSEPSDACDFTALFAFCQKNPEYRMNLNYIGAATCLALKDMAIMDCRHTGYNSQNAEFFAAHKNGICIERADTIQSRLMANTLKVMGQIVWLNSVVKRSVGRPFIRVKYEKTDEGMFKFSDAKSVALDFACAAEIAFGKPFYEVFFR